LAAGRISGGELVTNENGTVNILLGSGMIKQPIIFLETQISLVGTRRITYH
jgi:hypothetical protein